jgi:hypothetical protein
VLGVAAKGSRIEGRRPSPVPPNLHSKKNSGCKGGFLCNRPNRSLVVELISPRRHVRFWQPGDVWRFILERVEPARDHRSLADGPAKADRERINQPRSTVSRSVMSQGILTFVWRIDRRVVGED